jgi:hypothetical protein
MLLALGLSRGLLVPLLAFGLHSWPLGFSLGSWFLSLLFLSCSPSLSHMAWSILLAMLSPDFQMPLAVNFLSIIKLSWVSQSCVKKPLYQPKGQELMEVFGSHGDCWMFSVYPPHASPHPSLPLSSFVRNIILVRILCELTEKLSLEVGLPLPI